MYVNKSYQGMLRLSYNTPVKTENKIMFSYFPSIWYLCDIK
jgi:hypothetical protein